MPRYNNVHPYIIYPKYTLFFSHRLAESYYNRRTFAEHFYHCKWLLLWYWG